jgi:hypothetical protein
MENAKMLIPTKKHNIINSTEIYRVESVFAKYHVYIRTLCYLILTLFILLLIYEAIIHMPRDLSVIMVPGLLIPYVVVFMVLNRIFSRGNPLIFTKKGIYLEPFIYEYWEDLESYSFKKYEGIHRITFSTKGTGIALSISNKSVLKRTTNLRGHSYIATNGNFLSSNQVQDIMNIFNSYKIERNMLNDEIAYKQ